jgi:DNA-binding NarL/FixJ family response regulator
MTTQERVRSSPPRLRASGVCSDLGAPPAIRTRVLLADDHRLLREALARLLEPECEVVGTVADGRAVLAEVPRLRPDVVVLDIAMPLLNGLDAARQLRRVVPEVKIVFLTATEDADVAVEAFRLGASGFLVKNSAASELLQAVREVAQGRAYVTPLVTRGLIDALMGGHEPAGKSIELSARQREVLQLLTEGQTMKEIAHVLKITPRTVAFHKYSMMELLGVKSSAELVQFAVKHHFVPN